MNVIDFGLFQTTDPNMRKLLETAQSIALMPAPVLISGEQGTGKTLMARFVIEKSRTRHRVVRWGRTLEPIVDNDVVLVDRLDEMNLLQQQELSDHMDELKKKNLRIRWIAIASEKPAALVQSQRLRKDLFYRLSVIHLQIPSLRERSQDILVLAKLLSQVFNHMKSRPLQNFSAEAQAKLLAYSWPGNVSELESVIERAVSLTESEVIEASAIQFPEMEENLMTNAGTTLSEMERKLILQTLQLTQQNKTRAAQILGISIRTLRNKLHEYREAGIL